MSKKDLDLDRARELAERLVLYLEPGCQRIEIAGSVRRQKPMVGDLEIVCIPKFQPVQDLFGAAYQQFSCLDPYLTAVSFRELFGAHPVKGGDHYKQIELPETFLDLYITSPEQWGVIFTLRTGSAEFSKWLVTLKRYGGGCPSNLKIKDGRLWDGSNALETREESQLFQALKLKWIPPDRRERVGKAGSTWQGAWPS